MAWFICPYKWVTELEIGLYRYCAMNDFTEQLRVDNGRSPLSIEDHGSYLTGETPLWAECEFIGDRALVKVWTGASVAVLSSINAEPGFKRVPANALDLTLGDLTSAQLRAIWNEFADAGYTQQQVQNYLEISRWSELRNITLRRALRFLLSRWRRPLRWNLSTNEVEFESEDWLGGTPTTLRDIDERIE